MKKKIIILLSVILNFIFFFGFSQNETDALRYSQNFATGSSRFTSMGGAFGALGGDFSSLSSNPAGIGIFRKSEFSFSPSVFVSSTNTNHYGNVSFGNKSNFNFGNCGLVLTLNNGKNSGWVTTSLGFGYNRLNNFTTRISVEGANNGSSLLDLFKGQIEKNDFSLFGTQLAWKAYLIDFDSAGNKYFTVFPTYGETQKKSISKSGSIGETVFSLGGNYNNKLYLGGTVGLSKVRYSEISKYSEISNPKDTNIILNSFSLNENLSTSGSGINFKIGMIYRLMEFIRIGGAFHSPTFYDLSDKWDANLKSDFKDSSSEYSSDPGQINYSLSTPFKAIGSLALVFGKIGLISCDYEFVDYSGSRLSPSGASDYSFSKENNLIAEKYVPAGNIKLGTEWKINPFSLRAGFASYGNPFSSAIGNQSKNNCYSLGLGIREEGYFLDFAYVISNTSEKYFLYSSALINGTKINQTSQSFLVTLGFRF